MAKLMKPVGKAPQQRQKYDPRERFSDVSYPEKPVVDAAKRGLASINSEGRYAGNEDNYFKEAMPNSPWVEELPVESWLKGDMASKITQKPAMITPPSFSAEGEDPGFQITLDRLNELLGRAAPGAMQSTPQRAKPMVQSNGFIRESEGMYRDPKNPRRGVFRA